MRISTNCSCKRLPVKAFRHGKGLLEAGERAAIIAVAKTLRGSNVCEAKRQAAGKEKGSFAAAFSVFADAVI